MTLRPGATADDLREKVSRLDTAAGNIASAGTTAGPLRDAYIAWVEDVERTLQPYVTPEWLEGVHSERYWKIRDIDDGTIRPWPLIDAETKRQQGRLAALIVQAERAVPAAAPATADETVVIEDTNAHLHFASFDQIDWRRVAGIRHVLLAVPLAVIEELDNHKNRGGPRSRRG